MSVTNSNAKSAVKNSRKAKNAASASNTVLSAVLAQTEEQHVPLPMVTVRPASSAFWRWRAQHDPLFTRPGYPEASPSGGITGHSDGGRIPSPWSSSGYFPVW